MKKNIIKNFKREEGHIFEPEAAKLLLDNNDILITMNPNGRKIILYSSKPIGSNKVESIKKLGVIIISNQETLIKTIKGSISNDSFRK